MKNTESADTYVVIGRFSTAYGVKGWIKVQSHTENQSDIGNYSPWYIEQNKKHTNLVIEGFKPHNNLFLAKIAGFDTPETVKQFAGKHIYTLRSTLPTLESDSHYHRDLIGLTVINQRGETLGKVTNVMETGSNDVLIIHGESHIAVPYIRDKVITKIDVTRGEIHVNWDII